MQEHEFNPLILQLLIKTQEELLKKLNNLQTSLQLDDHILIVMSQVNCAFMWLHCHALLTFPTHHTLLGFDG